MVCLGGGIGRHAGLKILWAVKPVPVRPRPEVLKLKKMKFKNLGFIEHPVAKGIIAQIFTDEGKRISIVCGEGMYSSSKAGNRAKCSSVEDAASFEVMIGDGDPIGWQSRKDIDRILAENF